MNITLKRLLAISALAASALSLVGCQSNWDAEPEFGSSVNGAIQAQAKNPDAPKGNTKVLTGLDGPAAKSAVDSYQKTFERKAPVQQYSTGSMISGTGVSVQ